MQVRVCASRAGAMAPMTPTSQGRSLYRPGFPTGTPTMAPLSPASTGRSVYRPGSPQGASGTPTIAPMSPTNPGRSIYRPGSPQGVAFAQRSLRNGPLGLGSQLPRVPKDDRDLWGRASASESSAGSTHMAFVESGWFQGIVGCVIFCNALTIGAELEIEFEGWWLLELLILLFFTAELALRLCYHRWSFFETGGNLFDMLIVVSGIVDSWAIPLFTWLSGGRLHKSHDVLSEVTQAFRMLRIVRLVRLVKIVPPLYSLALGIAEAVQGMFWVLVFLVMMLYGAAILSTRMLGHGEVAGIVSLDNEAPAATDVREMFHSVSSSMFVLFEMMSCWSLMKFGPLFRDLPLIRLSAVLFYILMVWGLLAVMTGVVSEKMIAVKDALNQEEKNRDQVRRRIAGEKLRDLFSKVDKDGSGTISREEFDSVLLCSNLSKLLMEYTQVSSEELAEVFSWLDADQNGRVDIDEFIVGFNRLNEQVTPKSFLKFQEEATRTIRRLEKSLVASVNARFDALAMSVEGPLRKLSVLSDQVQHLEEALEKAEAELERFPEPIYESEGSGQGFDINAVEDRLADGVESLLLAVERFEEVYQDGSAMG
uniref:EF-hand domain-containing protein n=1 Tax=Alexandrium monilatum TaxID=311494 RepID=A0A7S4SFH4_9DINO